MNQQLSDLPSVINHLAYSADGQRLAASLFSDGIRIYDALNDYRSLPSDAQYGDQSYGVQFDPTGRLLTVSFDGVVRLYAADQYATPVARFEWKGHRPYSAAFSPEGARVAVADGATHDVVVLSGSDLTQLFKADTTGIADDRNVHAVAWSQDGRFLYAGGTWSVNGVRQVRRWDDGGRGAYVDVPTAPNNLVELIGLKSGSMLVGNAVGLELIGPDAKVTQMQGFGGLDLSIVGDPLLRVSAVFSDRLNMYPFNTTGGQSNIADS